MSQSIYALILAGGSGERFWPLSRRSRPKQLLQLVSEKTLLEETVTRLDGLVPPERILILTNVEQEAAVRAQRLQEVGALGAGRGVDEGHGIRLRWWWLVRRR